MARIPSESVSHSTTAPRRSGTRRRRPVVNPVNSSAWRTISPLGWRTATAMCRGARIITPSITACPP